jgi:hypothetical protein
MIRAITSLCVAALGLVQVAADYKTPPPILEPVTEWYGRYQNSRVGKITGSFTDSDGNADRYLLNYIFI